MKLREIVAGLLDSQDSSSHSFRRLYNLGRWGFQTEFSLDIKCKIKTVLLNVSPNKSAAFPCDYVQYSKVGVTNNRGEFVCFKVNNQLTTYHSDYFSNVNRLTGVPSLPSIATVNGGFNGYGYNDLLFLNYWYAGTSFNLFGLGSGTVDVGQFKVDNTNKVFLFAPQFQWDSFLLEYLSDGSDDEEEDYEVDIRMAEAVKCYLRWQDLADKPKKASAATVKNLRHEYYVAKSNALRRINPVILNEIQNAERRSWKMVAKA